MRDGDGAWTARLAVPVGEVVPVTVTRFERIGTAPLPLGTQSRDVGPIHADGTLEIGPDRYDVESLDRDGDTVSNLDEREAGTDPLRAPCDEDEALTEDRTITTS